MPHQRLLILGLIVALGGCDTNAVTDPGGVVCTAIAAAGLNVTVVDSLTGQPTAFSGLWARAREGSYTDSSAMAFTDVQTGAVRMALAYERAGTYVVTVHAAGYADWTKAGVTVTKGVCHVTGVLLTARLVK